MSFHTIYAVGYGATLAGGVTRQDAGLGMEVRGEATDGQPYPQSVHLYARKPQASWTTKALAEHLALCGPAGIPISGLSGGFKLYGQKIAGEGTKPTAGCYSLTYLSGLIVPVTLNVGHNTDAELSYALHAQTSSTNGNANAIVGVSVLQALPSLTAELGSSRYGLGPVELGGIAIAQLRGVSVAFGINVGDESDDGKADPDVVFVDSWQTRITVRGVDVGSFGAAKIPLDGKTATHLNTSIYLRKRLNAAQYVADAEDEHILITADGMAFVENPFSGSGNAPGECSVIVACRFDGTNAPIIFDLDAIIT